MTLLALTAIAVGIILFDRLSSKIQLAGPRYNWPTPLRVLTFTSFALLIGETITVGIFPVIG